MSLHTTLQALAQQAPAFLTYNPDDSVTLHEVWPGRTMPLCGPGDEDWGILFALTCDVCRTYGIPWELQSVTGGWADGQCKARTVGEWHYSWEPAEALIAAVAETNLKMWETP